MSNKNRKVEIAARERNIREYMFAFRVSRDEAIILLEEDEMKADEKAILEKYSDKERAEIIDIMMSTFSLSYEEARDKLSEWEKEESVKMGKKSRKRKRKHKHNNNNKPKEEFTMSTVHTNSLVSIESKLKNYKILVVGGAKDYANWTKMQLVKTVEEADLVMFTGGADINPELYGENVGTYTTCNYKRDDEELQVYKKALQLNKKIIGICRGAQLSCVMAGGKLIQHVTGHGAPHQMTLAYGQVNEDMIISSSHHQMLYPFDMPKEDYRILGWSKDKNSNTYLNGDDQEIALPKDFREVEIALFPKTKALAIQGHPEWMRDNSYTVKKLRSMLYTFMMIVKFKEKENEEVQQH